MTATSSVLNTTTAGAASAQIGSGLDTLANNFQSFLSLLTTQLKNQDPMSPMDTNQFTQQIVQMTSVQQQLLANNLLTTLVSQGLSSSVNYIGKTVEAANPDQTLNNGQATWTYGLPSKAASGQAVITNSSGTVVWSGTLPDLTQGQHNLSWNGKDFGGNQLQDGGTYTLSIRAQDSAGNDLTPQIVSIGTVTGVTQNQGTPYLNIGSTSVPMSSVISVLGASTTSGSSSGSGSNSNTTSSGS
jgi:flagellar basal-body rod modification protein FlgD